MKETSARKKRLYICSLRHISSFVPNVETLHATSVPTKRRYTVIKDVACNVSTKFNFPKNERNIGKKKTPVHLFIAAYLLFCSQCRDVACNVCTNQKDGTL